MKAFYVDFESWTIRAKTPDEAFKKAVGYIKKGYAPGITCSNDEADKIEADELGDNYALQLDCPKKVKIEVLGGVAECTYCDYGVEVKIQDHDNEKAG